MLRLIIFFFLFSVVSITSQVTHAKQSAKVSTIHQDSCSSYAEPAKSPFRKLFFADALEPDVCALARKIYDRDAEEFEAIYIASIFHGHFGPNCVIGVKMSRFARQLLKGSNYEISVKSKAGNKPPMSCLNDGIMTGIGATFGRGLISSSDAEKPVFAAEFTFKGRSVVLTLKPESLKKIRNASMESIKARGGKKETMEDVRKAALYTWEHLSAPDIFYITWPE